jgi:hypothetical protein
MGLQNGDQTGKRRIPLAYHPQLILSLTFAWRNITKGIVLPLLAESLEAGFLPGVPGVLCPASLAAVLRLSNFSS